MYEKEVITIIVCAAALLVYAFNRNCVHLPAVGTPGSTDKTEPAGVEDFGKTRRKRKTLPAAKRVGFIFFVRMNESRRRPSDE